MNREFLIQLLGEGELCDTVLQAHQQALAQYDARIRDMTVESAVREAGGRSVPAVRALMDEAAIAGSEDPAAAARAAVAAVKRENPYLFAPLQPYAPGTGTAGMGSAPTMEEVGKMSMEEYRRFRRAGRQ